MITTDVINKILRTTELELTLLECSSL